MPPPKKRSRLGNDPLAAIPSPVTTGIFSPTTQSDSAATDSLVPETPEPEKSEISNQPAKSNFKKKESRKKNQ